MKIGGILTCNEIPSLKEKQNKTKGIPACQSAARENIFT